MLSGIDDDGRTLLLILDYHQPIIPHLGRHGGGFSPARKANYYYYHPLLIAILCDYMIGAWNRDWFGDLLLLCSLYVTWPFPLVYSYLCIQ